ncbi:MAG: hypothetical protein GF409_02485 [Candidatus Omnitrophica bacterium]|nr:hypothetical protein [Candidatus Omnitrophota bacterium]
MNKVLLVLACVFMLITSSGYSQQITDEDRVFQSIQEDLLQRGLTAIEVRNMEVPVKNMLYVGADAEQVEKTVLDLKQMGLKGRVLTDAVFSMSYLVSMGASVQEAAFTVSGAAKKSIERGIMGKNLAIEIEKAVKKRSRELWDEKQ